MPRYRLRTLLIALALEPPVVVTALIALNKRSPMPHFDFTAIPGVARPHKPATENEVREVETTLGLQFPEDYREFLKTINGINSPSASTSVNLEVPMKTRTGEDDEPWAINSLFSVSKAAEFHNNLLAHQTAYRFDKRVPRRYVIIGSTFGPDLLCLSLAEPDCGKVYFWLPDNGSAGQASEEPTTKDLWHVADSFLEFWSMLRLGR